MKVRLINVRNNTRPNQVGIIKDFVSFLQNAAPLHGELEIDFVSERSQEMTTGRNHFGKILVLTSSRILVDILRTLAHEWVHEFQRQKGQDSKPEKELEDQANSISGYFIREFMKQNPEHEVEVYKD